ncbi:MAG: HAMP domain-containing histidine kinase [Candidatus Heimdallarchaeota archaeon]|nr:HAMP domain-containing histidine kinase [Candidatus Heimdallarchaeota archaeon]
MQNYLSKVFCLFRTEDDLENFYISDLAQSDVFRCIISIKKDRDDVKHFYSVLSERYDVKHAVISTIGQKTIKTDILESKCNLWLNKTIESEVRIYLDFSSSKIAIKSIMPIVNFVERLFQEKTAKFSIYSVFLEKNLTQKQIQQHMLNYPYICLNPSHIRPNFYHDTNARKIFPKNLRDIYQPFEILIEEIKSESLEVERLEKQLFQQSTQNNILEFTLASYLSQDQSTIKSTGISADFMSLMEFQTLRKKFLQKEQILRTIIHDLKSPLASIQGYSEVIVNGLSGPVTQETKNHLSTIISNTKRLALMVDSLLEYEQYDRSDYISKRETIDLINVLNEAKMAVLPKMIQRGQKITIFAPESLEIVANPQLLVRALQNLLDNSIKYSPTEKGQIKVSVEEKESMGGKIIITVQDNGFGFHKKDLLKAFEPFSRFEAHSKSTGLGLSIVKKIIEEIHGGAITIFSPGRNKGTTVKIILDKT